MANKFISFLELVGNDIKKTVTTKRYGFYVAVAAWGLTFILTICYACVGEMLYNPNVIVACVLGMVFFAVLMLFGHTSRLAPVVLMICNLCALFAFIKADEIVTVFSELFFDGFTLGKLFSLAPAEWMSVFLFILTIITSSVAMYMPQNKKVVKIDNEAVQSDNGVNEQTQTTEVAE